MDGKEQLMTVKEVATYLRTTKAVVYTYICTGKLPASLYIRLGRKILFRRDNLDEYLFKPEPNTMDLIQGSILQLLQSYSS